MKFVRKDTLQDSLGRPNTGNPIAISQAEGI